MRILVVDDEAAVRDSLARVREAVEAHGGTASLDAAPGKGTTVLLRLPTTRPAPAPR